MIQEEYVSFEVAKLLKEKGFDEPCRFYYFEPRQSPEMFPSQREHKNSEKVYGDNTWIAPTQARAMRWLREIHNISVELWAYNGKWCVSLVRVSDGVDIYVKEFDTSEYSTYEEAAEVAIKYCLEKLI